MSDSKDWKAGGSDPAGPAPRPLPPHLDPRRARGGVPPRPPRTAPAKTALPPVRRQGRLARALSVLAAVLSFAVFASAVGGYVLVTRYDGNISRLPGLELGQDRPVDAPRDAQNVLIVGSDSRGGLAAGEGTQGRGASFVTGQRSDTVILAHLYGNSDTAQLVSFPRDSWVTIPAYLDDDGKQVAARESKLNRAFFEGGPALLIDTIQSLTGLSIDRYVQVDFDGFQTIVNRLDGVEVCLAEAAKEKLSGIDLQAGRQTIKGDQALAFVRQRYGLPNGDIDRIRRQQQFIGGIVRKALSAGTLANPLRLNGVIDAATDSLRVDDGTSFGDLQDLALRFRGFSTGGVIFTTVPIADQNAKRQRQDVVLLDEAELTTLFDQMRRDIAPQTPDAAPSAAPSRALLVRPGAVRVRVYNGSGVTGLGRKAFGDLERVGFQLVGTAGNRGADAARTTVLHGRDKADSARTLAAAIPGSVVKLDPALDSTLEVVLGTSYTGTRAVTVTAASEPRRPSASTSPAVRSAAQDPCAP